MLHLVGLLCSYIFWVCVCSLMYPACNAHEPYCHLRPVRVYNIFPHYLINVTILRKKKVTEHKMCVLIFSTTFVWNISHSKEELSEILLKMCIGLHVKYRLFLSDCNEIWIFSAGFSKIFKCQISWKSVRWEPSCSTGTDISDEANTRFSQTSRTRQQTSELTK